MVTGLTGDEAVYLCLIVRFMVVIREALDTAPSGPCALQAHLCCAQNVNRCTVDQIHGPSRGRVGEWGISNLDVRCEVDGESSNLAIPETARSMHTDTIRATQSHAQRGICVDRIRGIPPTPQAVQVLPPPRLATLLRA